MASEGMALEDDGRMSEEATPLPPGRTVVRAWGTPTYSSTCPPLASRRSTSRSRTCGSIYPSRPSWLTWSRSKSDSTPSWAEAKLGIKGVEAQAQLKARLDNVRAIFSEVLASLQHNPQFFRGHGHRDRRTDG